MSAALRASNVALIQGWVDALNAPWDMDALAEIFAEDVDYRLPWLGELGFPTQLSGRDAAIAFLRDAAAFVEPENVHNVRIHTLEDDPNELFAQYSVDTRLIASGLPYKNDLLIRATARDGKIARFVEYFNPVVLLVAMGGGVELPAPAQATA